VPRNLNEAISVKNTQTKGNTSGNEINEKLRDEGRPQNIMQHEFLPRDTLFV